MLPENGASMADAARTRENEGPCICDGCGFDPASCNLTEKFCEANAAAYAEERQEDARKERDL
jgi:hypothetical protein